MLSWIEWLRLLAKRAWIVGLLLLGLGTVGLAVYRLVSTDPAQGNGGVDVSDAELRTAYLELCGTRTLIEEDAERAGDQFFGRVHSPLHIIAARAQDRDRAVAARMLEAKNDVERSFNDRAPAGETALALDRLLVRTQQALISIGVTPSTCDSP